MSGELGVIITMTKTVEPESNLNSIIYGYKKIQLFDEHGNCFSLFYLFLMFYFNASFYIL